MIYIDKFASTNRLSVLNPIEKFIYGLITFVISLSFHSAHLYITIIITNSIILLYAAKIPVKFFLKLFLIPLYFLFPAVIAIAVEKTYFFSSKHYLFSFLNYGVTVDNLQNGTIIFMKSFSGVSCLYFISLTIPLGDIVRIFRKLKTPELLIELTLLMYRFVFIMIEIAEKIQTAQKARLGSSSYTARFRSLIKLSGTLFILSFKKYQDIYNALESRCYQGKFKHIPIQHAFSPFIITLIIILETSYITIGILTR
jgi:cobalt/nickel transport system permease protein